MLGKTNKIWADLAENRLNSGSISIPIFHKKFEQTLNCPPPPPPPPLGKRQPRTPMPSHAPSATRNLIKITTFCFLFTLLYYKDLKHILYIHFKLITLYSERFHIWIEYDVKISTSFHLITDFKLIRSLLMFIDYCLY